MPMTRTIEFVRNYHDLSTSRGFQFEFSCDRCGAGYRTEFQPTVTGTLTNMLDAASSIFGGMFGTAHELGEKVNSISWQKAHDEALAEAVATMKPSFIQCPHCLAWVCRKSCWSAKHGLCKSCAPDVGVEMSAAQASKTKEHVWEQAVIADEDKDLGPDKWHEPAQATCPQCEAPLPKNSKFCPECGAAVKVAAHCNQCGAKLTAKAKFCPDCGAKAGV